MKKVVILSAFLSPFRSGAEAMVEEVSKYLAKQYDITIVTGLYDRSLPREAELDASGVRVIRVGIGHSIDKFLFPFLALRVVRQLKPDIIHAVLESYAGFGLMLCRWFVPKPKRILTLQSTNTSFLLGPIHRSAQVLTAISSALRKRAKKFGTQKVHVIPNGVSLSAVQDALTFHQRVAGRVLFVGRLESMKGVDMVLRAFHDLVYSKSPKPFHRDVLHLRIVGDGSLRQELERLAKQLHIEGRVTFVGKISPKAVYDEYAQAQVFCALSRSEALGNVFIEAQAAGCAVVATQVGGIPDIVQNGQTGFLVEPDQEQSAAHAMLKLLSDDELRAKVTVAAMVHAKAFDWGQIAQLYAHLYG